MMTTSTITGRDGARRTHRVRIGKGFGDVRYIECDTCGYRKRARFDARRKADSHLATHGVAGEDGGMPDSPTMPQYVGRATRQEVSPLPWILALVGIAVLGVLAAVGGGR